MMFEQKHPVPLDYGQKTLTPRREGFANDPSSSRIRSLSCRSQPAAAHRPERRELRRANGCLHWQRGTRIPALNLSKLLGQADEKAAPGAILRGEDADAGAIAKLIDLIEQVHCVEPHSQRLLVRRQLEFV